MVFSFKVEYVWIKNTHDLKQKIEWNVFAWNQNDYNVQAFVYHWKYSQLKKKLKVYNVFKLFFMNFMIKIMILMINSNYFFITITLNLHLFYIDICIFLPTLFFQFADRYQQWITYPFTRAPLKYIQINNKNINTKYERMLIKITKLERRSWVWFTYTTKFSLKKY